MANQGWADITTMRNKSQLEADGNEICVAFHNWIQAMISTFYWECTVACLILEPAQVVNILLWIADYRGMWVCFKFVFDAGCSAFSIMERDVKETIRRDVKFIFSYISSKDLALQIKLIIASSFFVFQFIYMCHEMVMLKQYNKDTRLINILSLV